MRFLSLALTFLATIWSVDAHSKLYCTDLRVDGAGNIVGCNGSPPDGSTYEHIWGFSNIDNKIGILRGLNLPDQYLLEDVVARRRTMCTGSTPPVERQAQVRPGQTLLYLWSLNGHNFDNFMKWEGRGVSPNQAEPQWQDWVNSRQIGRNTYRDDAGSQTRCQNFQYGDNSALDQIMRGQPEVNEFRMCWGPYTIPNEMPAGLNRILYEWDHAPNDAHFYDCAWVNVIKDDQNNNNNNNNNNNDIRSLVPQGEDPKFVSPLVFDVDYYNSRYGDLQQVLGGDRRLLVQHWYQFGMHECRDSSPNFSVAYYLNAWSDLKRAFGDDCRAAVNHYLDYGRNEGRQTIPNGGGIRAQSAGPESIVVTSKTLIHQITSIGMNQYRATLKINDVTNTTITWTMVVNMNQQIKDVTATTGITATLSTTGTEVTLKSTTMIPSNVVFTFAPVRVTNTTQDPTGSQPWPTTATFQSDTTGKIDLTVLAKQDENTAIYTGTNSATTKGSTGGKGVNTGTYVTPSTFVVAVLTAVWAAIRQ